MNVILIISDTLRRDCLGCYGTPPWAKEFTTRIGRVHTPHLDRFATIASVYENAFISSFPTVPARNDIMTGRYTWTYKPWSPLDPGTVTLQETLNRAGVLTGLVADTPHPFAPGFNYQRGFETWELIRGQEHDHWRADPADVVFPCKKEKLRSPEHTMRHYLRNVHDRRSELDYFPSRTFREAADWLERNHRRQPFFLYTETFDPHEPWDPPQHYVDLYDPGYQGEAVIYPRYDLVNYLNASELRHCRALYAGEVTLVDRWVGYLLDRIEALGLMNNTAIIFLSDHGFYLGEHGYIGKSLINDRYLQAIPLYPEVARIPFLLYRPRRKAARVKDYVQTVDLMPTILELLQIPIPAEVQASSILEAKRDFVISSPTISHANLSVPHPTTRSSIYRGDWLLVYGAQVDTVKDSETTQMVDSMLRSVRTLEKGPIRPALYHLPSDPGCRRNVLSKHRTIAQQLHRRYVTFLEEADVPERHLRFFRHLR